MSRSCYRVSLEHRVLCVRCVACARCVSCSVVWCCALVDVCWSQCCCAQGIALQENNNFKNHGAADSQKHPLSGKNVEPLLVSRASQQPCRRLVPGVGSLPEEAIFASLERVAVGLFLGCGRCAGCFSRLVHHVEHDRRVLLSQVLPRLSPIDFGDLRHMHLSLQSLLHDRRRRGDVSHSSALSRHVVKTKSAFVATDPRSVLIHCVILLQHMLASARRRLWPAARIPNFNLLIWTVRQLGWP